MLQNSPNPFKVKTEIRFAVPEKTTLSLEIYDILGNKVRTLIDDNVEAGVHTVEWDATGDDGVEVAPGIYYCKVKDSSFSALIRMAVVR